jgi:hypothetical protein
LVTPDCVTVIFDPGFILMSGDMNNLVVCVVLAADSLCITAAILENDNLHG